MDNASRKKKVSINEVLDDQGRREKELELSQKTSSKAGSQRASSMIRFFPILILLLAASAVYFNALFGDFVYDDFLILDNTWVKDIRNIPAVFSNDIVGFLHLGQATLNYYRPMMLIVGMFDYYLFGLKPLGLHLVNVLFHCGVSVLVFLIMRRLLTGHKSAVSSVYFSPPFIGALLFATHPIHTEAVTWISGGSDVFFTFFYLLSFYLYVSFRDGTKGGYILSVLSFSAAAFSKEPALTLPIILIAYDYYLKKLDETIFASIRRYVPYIIVSAIYLLMRYHVLKGVAPIESYTGLTTYQYVINIFPLFSEYLTSLLWPFNLNLWHSFHPISSLLEAKGMISIAVSVIFFIVAMEAYRKNKLIFFGLLLLVIPLMPAFYIKGISGGKPFAERYLYLPSVGYVLLLAIFLSWANEKLPRAVRSITIVFMVICVSYAVGTIDRNNVWKDNFNLWSDTAKKSPDSAIAHNNLGGAYASQGQFDRAIAEYQAALRLNADYADAHNNLGLAYASQGQFDRAVAEYQTALRLNPDFADAHHHLGVAYANQGQFDKEIAEYQAALRLKPNFADANYNLGCAYESQGQFDRAIVEFQKALLLKPDDYEARRRLNDIVSKRQ